MAVYAMTATQVVFNSQDHTSKCKSAKLKVTGEQLDTTNFGSSGWKEFIGGLKGATVTLLFMEDFADDSLDEDIFAILQSVVAMTLKPTGSAISTSNPEFQFNVLVNDWEFGGPVGELGMKEVSWPVTAAITRDVTP